MIHCGMVVHIWIIIKIRKQQFTPVSFFTK